MNIALNRAAFAVLGLGLFACTATATTFPGDNPQPIGLGQPTPTPTATGTTTTTPEPPPTPQRAQIRFANAAYQTGAVDFCVKKQGASTWEGPLLAKLGVTTGADQGAMTNAFDRESGAWEVATISAKSTSCDKPIATSKSAVTLPANGSALVVLIGNGGVTGSEGNAVVALVDDTKAPTADKARIRFLHASPNWLGGTAEVYLAGSSPTFSGIDFGQSASYVDVVPAFQVVVRGLEDFNGEREVYGSFTAKAGSRATMILEGAAGSGFYPPKVVTCPDDLKTATASAAFVTCR